MAVGFDKRTGKFFFKRQIRLPNGKSARPSGYATTWGQENTKEGAKNAETIAIAQLLSTGTLTPPGRGDAVPDMPQAPARVPTVKEYLPLWLAEAETTNAEATLDHKRSTAANHIEPTFGHLRLDEIKREHIIRWHASLVKPSVDPVTGRTRKRLEPQTVAKLLSEFRAFLNFAVTNEVITRLPKKWPKEAIPEETPRFLTFEEAERLIAAPPPVTSPPWSAWKWRVMHAMLVVAIRTGLRHGELIGLRWQNVDLGRGVLWVRESISNRGNRKEPKGKKPREVPLSNDALRALRSIQQSRWESVFTVDGSLLKPHQTGRALDLMCRSAGMLPFGWHRLRHTFASHLAIRHVSLLAIQKLMGHVNMRDTLRYAHLLPPVLQEAVMQLDGPAPEEFTRAPKKRRRPRAAPDVTDQPTFPAPQPPV